MKNTKEAKNAKEKTQFQANRVFTDRVDPMKKFEEEAQAILTQDKYKKIVVFYGVGGIGKSRFIREIKNQNRAGDKLQTVKIGLDFYEYDNPATILFNIRKNIKGVNFSMFDYAFANYLVGAGLPASYVQEKYKSVGGVFSEQVFKQGKELIASFIPGFKYIESLVKAIPQFKKAINFSAKKEQFKEIGDLSDWALFERLPHILASAVNEAGVRLVLLFDDYESMLNKMHGSAVCEDCSEWIKRLFGALDNVLTVITAREKIEWESLKRNGQVEQFYIDRLTEADERKFLSAVPIEEADIIDSIVGVSQGIPLFLDLCVDLYTDYKNGLSERFELESINHESLIDRYIRHFDANEQLAVQYVSFLESFDRSFFDFLLKEQNIALNEAQKKSLLEKSLFVKTEEDGKIKIDTSVRIHIRSFQKTVQAGHVCVLILKYLHTVFDGCGHDYRMDYLTQLAKLTEQYSVQFSVAETERLVCIVNRLADVGHFTAIKTLTQEYFTGISFTDFRHYVYLLCLKRAGKITEALAYLSEHAVNGKSFGKMRKSHDLLVNQLVHLSGRYDEALKGYQNIKTGFELLNNQNDDRRSYDLADLKYADILCLKGRFREALAVVDGFDYEAHSMNEIMMEYRRLKGHIYRFNFQLDKAEVLYEYILDNVYNDNKLKGALYNNLAETFCLENPDKALAAAEQSLSLNGQIQADLEIGKTYAAKSMAHATRGEAEEAFRFAALSERLQAENGYHSGVLFAKVAKIYALSRFGSEKDELERELTAAEALHQTIGVYTYLLNFARLAAYKDERYFQESDWLEPDKTREVVKRLL